MQKWKPQNSSIRHTLRISRPAPVGRDCSARRQGQLVVQDDAEQRMVDVDLAVRLVDEAHVAEFVHEKIDSRPRSTDHLRQRLLRYFGK
jgi:hypothetical protein